MNQKSVFEYLDLLLNKKIDVIGRAANLLWIGLGKQITVLDWKKREVQKNEMALHVEGMWRFIGKEGILFASEDMYIPKSSMEYSEDFEWEITGSNLFDEKSEQWINKEGAVYIVNYKLNELNDLTIYLSNKERIEIYANASDDSEFWRIFKCGVDEKHLVATGLGVEFQ